ncbi:hypothetical protein P3X46_010192 [Hevea brasiliensis]|uniref:EF-hand domain-containing protein n=1 Tax=Hevea brasiliensis TaxID=3981 RepID=A0ABQ9MHG2_HEVBR|nr:hypothetical protein P3X46_010192 [Hevea brasiliensis]
MTTTPTPNSIFEIEWKRDAIKKVIKQFDEDCDGKLISAELNRCLTSCSGIHIDDGEIKRFLPNVDDSKINISEILQDSDGDENNFFQELRDMEAISFKWMAAKEVHVVINMNHLNKTLPPITIQKNISKLRDIFMGLTGQAAVSFITYVPMASSSVSPTHLLYIIVAANAMAFLFLLLSFLLGGKKSVAVKKITGAIGIAAAVMVLFLMMGMVFLPVKFV